MEKSKTMEKIDSFAQKQKAKIRRRRKSKPSEGKGGNTSGYTDDEGFGSCNEQHTTNGPESLNLSLNGNLTAPNTTVTTPLTPATPTAPLAKTEDLDEIEKQDIDEDKQATGVNEIAQATEEAPTELSAEEKKKMLRKFPFFKLEVVVGSGRDLIAMDRGGTSDPYLKCVHGQDKLFQTLEKKKTCNPMWAETFVTHVDNPFKPITFQVFDKDIVGSDDFMGEAEVDLQELSLTKQEEFHLELNDGGNEDLVKKNKKRKKLGTVNVRITMKPMTKEEMNEERLVVKKIEDIRRSQSSFSLFSQPSEEAAEDTCYHRWTNKKILRSEKMGGGKGKSMAWSSVVHVVLIQAQGLTAMDAGMSSDPYCKLTLGKEKFRSKSKSETINPKWRESFDFNWYEEFDNELEVSIWDKDVGSKDDFMGRIIINLNELPKETTCNMWKDVEDGKGRLHLLVTASATTRGDSPSNLGNWEEDLDNMKEDWVKQYTLPKSFKKIKDVGHLLVKVLKAQGLSSADIGGKSDPFCVLELNNDRVSTHTEYKTLAPIWQKVYQFDVKDIHDWLEVTIYDEDKDHKYEFLGKVKIPLLKIRNNERRWYSLKDKTLRKPAKGDHPQILLEMFFVYSKVRASIRTFNPRQLKYEDKSDIKFKASVLNRNLNRIKAATAGFDPDVAIQELKSILAWENKAKTMGAYIGFMLGVYFLEPWMITLGLVVPFVINIVVLSVTGGWNKLEADEEEEDDDDEGEKEKKGEEEKKSLKEKMQQMQDITLMVQNVLGFIAHILECIGNVCNFCVPFVSWLAFVVLCIVTVVLYYIPLRYLLMAWGTNKFFKKLIKPNAIPNNELADFISRVPDNEELKDAQEMPSPEDVAKAKLQVKKKPASDAEVI